MFDKVSISMSKTGKIIEIIKLLVYPQPPILGLMCPADLKAVIVATDLHKLH